MISEGEYLRLKLDNLFVKKGKDDITIPLSDISMIIIENLEAILTSRLLDACAQYNVAVVVCDYKHLPSGIYTGLNTHSRVSKVLQKQLKWTNKFKNDVWQHIVKGKIHNQLQVLIKYNIIEGPIELLNEYCGSVKPGDITNREGHAAKVYFNCLFGLEFNRRSDNLINACLDYSYSVLRAFVARLVVGYGMTGLIGLFHKNEYNNFNLVDDLMEPFRPFVDAYVIKALDRHEAFTLDLRIELVDFLNSDLVYCNQKTIMSSCIEKYIHSFIRLSDDFDLKKFILPEHQCESV